MSTRNVSLPLTLSNIVDVEVEVPQLELFNIIRAAFSPPNPAAMGHRDDFGQVKRRMDEDWELATETKPVCQGLV
eukprot:scaffold672_cov126-Cylindrotheca_fusiformis.AAC.20